LPPTVLEKMRSELKCLPGENTSIFEMGHYTPGYLDLHECIITQLRTLANVPDSHAIVFLQGGARMQFAMAPLNLQHLAGAPHYIVSGIWSKQAAAEFEKLQLGPCTVDSFSQQGDLYLAPQISAFADPPSFTYLCTNETVHGVQYHQPPVEGDIPIVGDASSDFLSRPIDLSRYSILFACAQKNLGIAGLTIAIVNPELIEHNDRIIPTYLDYRAHINANSMYNTPPMFQIYVLGLMCEWIEQEFGDLEQLSAHNKAKAKLLYDVLDESEGFYRGCADPAYRSDMNVTFRLPSEALESLFLSDAEESGLIYLKGHKSFGCIRASIYNAMPIEGVKRLRAFMEEFAARHR
ncbi:MAG: 3-phosphoserine/phosphohydroxythreonine transaminase, partial [Pseudomonadota bacterium]